MQKRTATKMRIHLSSEESIVGVNQVNQFMQRISRIDKRAAAHTLDDGSTVLEVVGTKQTLDRVVVPLAFEMLPVAYFTQEPTRTLQLVSSGRAIPSMQ